MIYNVKITVKITGISILRQFIKLKQKIMKYLFYRPFKELGFKHKGWSWEIREKGRFSAWESLQSRLWFLRQNPFQVFAIEPWTFQLK